MANLKKSITWALHRLNEPTTYAGFAAAALGAAQVAQTAKSALDIYKTQGPLLGLAAILAGIAAVIKPEGQTPPKGPIIDAEFTEVKKPE